MKTKANIMVDKWINYVVRNCTVNLKCNKN